MISAFGIEHGEFAKGLRPANLAALGRVARKQPGTHHGAYAANKTQAAGIGRAAAKPRSAGPARQAMATAGSDFGRLARNNAYGAQTGRPLGTRRLP